MIIRNELEKDYREVEELTRKAFWNLHTQGCNEHYVVHVMRNHKDFISELDFVIEHDGSIIANIMYTKAWIVENNGRKKEILTFGPVSVMPEYQRKGYGRKILEHSFEKAIELGYDVIVIFGHPENYIPLGFKSCKKHNICIGEGVFPMAMLALELSVESIPKGNWVYYESDAYDIDESSATEFDKSFDPLVKEYKTSQELFYIYSRSKIVE